MPLHVLLWEFSGKGKDCFQGPVWRRGAGREALAAFPAWAENRTPHCPTMVRPQCPGLQGLLFPAHPPALAPLKLPEPQNSYLRGSDAALIVRSCLPAGRPRERDVAMQLVYPAKRCLINMQIAASTSSGR